MMVALRGILVLALLAIANIASAQSEPPSLALATVLTPTASEGLAPDALVLSQAALIGAQLQFDNISLRLAALRSGSGGKRSGLAFAPTGPGGPMTLMWNSLADEPKAAEAGAEFSRLGFFAAASFGNGDTDAGIVLPGTDFDSRGITAGLDYRFSDAWILGGSIGINRQDTDLALGQGQVDADGWVLSAYSTYYNADSWYADAVASYGRTDFDIRREIGTQVITGNPEGDSLSFAASFGRDFNKGAWGYGPIARLQYTRINFDSFTERVNGTGPVAPQSIDTRSVTSLSSVIGGKMNYVHSTSWGVVIPHLDAEWQHEFRGDPSIIEANYVGTVGKTVIVGDPIDPNFFKIGVGLSFVMPRGKSGFVYYDRILGAERLSKSHFGLGVRIEF